MKIQNLLNFPLDLASQQISIELSPEEVLENYLVTQRITYHYKSNSFMGSDGKVVDDRLLKSQLRLYCWDQGHDRLRSYLEDAMRVWKESQSVLFLSRQKENLAFRERNNELKKFSFAVTGKDSLIEEKIWEHFIWQVKRKIMGLPVEHHMLVCLFGKSGAGKSVAIHKLLEPVKDLKLDADFSLFSDRFGLGIWERNYVIFCDEMGEIRNTSIEKLKNIITAQNVESRAMRSEKVMSVKQNATFIAASNIELRDLIIDPTSARRYYQIDCQDKIDWAQINEIDYWSLWRSVDETSPCPIIPFLDEIRSYQEANIRAKCNVEKFIEECCVVSEFSSSSPTTKELYKEFSSFCRLQGISSFEGVQQFSRRLPKVLGTTAHSKHTNKGTVWPLFIRSSVN